MVSANRYILRRGFFCARTVAAIFALLIFHASYASGQNPEAHYKIINGVRTLVVADSTKTGKDTLAVRSADLSPVEKDTTTTARERRKLARLADTSTVRYSKLFRDTMPISRVCLLSAVAPGFGQLYNKQAWKIPILYGTVAATAYLGFRENSLYKEYKSQYSAMKRQGATQHEMDPIESQMIRHNTGRTLLWIGSIASYIYFIGDAALNYKGAVNSVKKATTLSTICPGAGQIYNRSYWKLPIVVGGIATMGYVIDFNNRGYQRFKLALDQKESGQENEFGDRYSTEYLQKIKKNYRRNRDLCIIIAAGLYLLNIVDAHVDAQMKDYDISDDLSMTLEPTVVNMYTMRSSNVNGVGLAFKINF